MSVEFGDEKPFPLPVPESLLPGKNSTLPELKASTLEELKNAGWVRVGLMVAFVDSKGKIMMLEHNGNSKNGHGVLGPLGETSQHSGPIIEQPLETLYRGIQEEMGIQYPSNLELWMHQKDGWTINQWPRGVEYPNQYACAISFPIFLPDSVRDYLLSIPHGTEEVRNISFVSPEILMLMDETELRPGVKDWLRQLASANLLDPNEKGDLHPIDFSGIYASALRDIELK